MRRFWRVGLAACLGIAGAWVHGDESRAQATQELTVIVYGGSFEEGCPLQGALVQVSMRTESATRAAAEQETRSVGVMIRTLGGGVPAQIG